MSRRKKILRYVVGFALMACSLPLFVFAGYLYGFEKGHMKANEAFQISTVIETREAPVIDLEPIVISAQWQENPVRNAVETALTVINNEDVHAQFADVNKVVKNAAVTQDMLIFSNDRPADRTDLDSVTTLLWQYGSLLVDKKDYEEARSIFQMISDKLSEGKVRDYRGLPVEIQSKVKEKLKWLEKQDSVAKANPK